MGDILNAASHAATAPVTIAAGKFKASCLELLDRSAQGEIITITKRGKIAPQLFLTQPAPEQPVRALLGRMKSQITIHGDIVGPDSCLEDAPMTERFS